MSKFLKLWTYLSGKKTTIGAILMGLANISTAIGQPEVAVVLDRAGNFLVATGLAHKVVKTAQ